MSRRKQEQQSSKSPISYRNNHKTILRLLQKYQNVKKEISNQHQNDMIRLEKTLKNPSSLTISKFYGSRYMGSTSRFSAANKQDKEGEQN